MADPFANRDLTRTTLGVLFLVLLASASLWVLRPFLLPMVWGATIVVATWPLLTRMETRLGGKRWLATIAFVAMMLGVFVVPITALIGVLLAHSDELIGIEQNLQDVALPAPPDWLAKFPLGGEKLVESWTALAAKGPDGLAGMIAPHAGGIAKWVLASMGEFGMFLFEFLLTTAFAALFFARGEFAERSVRDFAQRLAGPQGESAVVLAGQAIRGVALGVVVTALIQAIAGGLGLAIAGVPFASLLMAAMFLLSVAQLGAAPVLALSSVWLFWQGSVGWGIAMAVWTLVVGGMDNVIRPLLIRRGVDLPVVLVFVGVVGGLIAFGVIGIFVGPVLLAVCWALMRGWVGEEEGEGVVA